MHNSVARDKSVCVGVIFIGWVMQTVDISMCIVLIGKDGWTNQQATNQPVRPYYSD